MGNIKTNLYFWSRSHSKQPLLWLLLREKTYSNAYLKFHTYLEENSARPFQSVFDKSSRVAILVFPRK